MMTKMMKWVAIVALLSAAIWRPSAGFEVLLQFVVCMSALLVSAQAWRARKYLWAVGFVSIAVLFNPVAPVGLSRGMFLWLDVACLATFLISLAAVKTTPRLSVSGIIRPNRLNESL
jgi:hypothetical protein